MGAARAELPPFDLILGSDILYDSEHHAALAETIAALSRPGTTVLICTPDGSCTDLHHPFCAPIRVCTLPVAPALACWQTNPTPFSPHGRADSRMRELGFDCHDLSTEPAVAALLEECSEQTLTEAERQAEEEREVWAAAMFPMVPGAGQRGALSLARLTKRPAHKL